MVSKESSLTRVSEYSGTRNWLKARTRNGGPRSGAWESRPLWSTNVSHAEGFPSRDPLATRKEVAEDQTRRHHVQPQTAPPGTNGQAPGQLQPFSVDYTGEIPAHLPLAEGLTICYYRQLL